MLTFPPTIQVFVCKEAVDLRKSFDGLSGCVEQLLKSDPLSGHLFVFFNRRRTQVKILSWDRTGFCIWYKRLSQGCFSTMGTKGVLDGSSSCTLPELMLILEGIDLVGARYRKRFTLPVPQAA
jgi:transposase